MDKRVFCDERMAAVVGVAVKVLVKKAGLVEFKTAV